MPPEANLIVSLSGMGSREPSTLRSDNDIRQITSRFPPRSARGMKEMDERSARRNHKTGCHFGPTRSFS